MFLHFLQTWVIIPSAFTESGGIKMKLNKEQQMELADCLLNMGQLLLDCGAEISRVEETISRMGVAYGAIHVEVFVITSIISLSLEFPDEEPVTDTRRIYSSKETDFYRLEKLNELSRLCCTTEVDLEELREKLMRIAQGRKPAVTILLGSVLASGGFAVFFGGTVWDGLAAAVFALGICLLQSRLEGTRINVAGENLLISLLTGLCVGLLCKFLPGLHMDQILMGDIMLLIPGLAMTNAVRNMLVGNTISGIVRLTESLIWATALAGGFMTAILIIDLL